MQYGYAITRKPGPEMVAGLSTAGLGKPDYELALKQHEAYCRALAACGLFVTTLAAEPGFPDACFVEDTAVVVDEIAVITNPGAPSRNGEVESMIPQLEVFRKTARITAPGTLDGGDVLQLGKKVYVGISGRTNREGAAQLATALAPFGYEVTEIKLAGGLHLKSGVNYLDEHTLLATNDLAGRPEFAEYEVLAVPDQEAYAANVLGINGKVIVPVGFPRVLAMLQKAGRDCLLVDASEYRKLDGGLTCLSLRLT